MKAFTLIEMIFVIIIVGILSIGAMNAIPDNTLTNNSDFIYNKILEKKGNSLGFDANMSNSDENRTVCIVFNKEWLKNDESYSKVKFQLSNRISIDSDINTLCFDYMGRPYNGNVDLDNFSTLLSEIKTIKILYNKRFKTITIYPMTGDVEIK